VVPALLLSPTVTSRLIEDLEIRYLANRDPNLLFGLLTDFPDANERTTGADSVLDACVEGIRRLNARYGDGQAGPFCLFHRSREWNPSESKWMGRERKRGKLNDLNRLLLGRGEPGFQSFEEELAKGGPAVEPPPITDITQAFQPYTSGSTGRPKGAVMTHRGMLWYVAYNQRYWPSAETDRGLIALPLFHKNALRGTVKPMLYAGGSFVLMPHYEPRAYLDALAKYKCTFSRGVAAVFTMFLQHRDYLRSLDLSALRGMTIGSAVVTPELMDAVERALPHVKVSESYGLTEGGSPLRPPVDGRPVPRGSPGVPAPEIELRLVDAHGTDSIEEGELLIRCPYVCLGYYNEPEITRAKLTDGWLHTGDIFSKDQDGFFYFRSRVDDMFSCGGENVYPKEVENLLFAHPDVVNAVVAPVPHAVKGLVPAAMVVLREGASVSADGLKAYCLDKGAAYAHPRFVQIVDALPLNGAGKIDRRIAQAKLAAAYAGNIGEKVSV